MFKFAELYIGIELYRWTKSKINATAKEVYLATCFLLGSDKHRYGRLLQSTEKTFFQNVNKYSKTISNAHSLLNYKQDPRNIIKMVGQISDGIAFTTVTTEKKRDAHYQPLKNEKR